MKTLFPKETWLKISQYYVEQAMSHEYIGPDDPEAILRAILARIEGAEASADMSAMKHLLGAYGLTLV